MRPVMAKIWSRVDKATVKGWLRRLPILSRAFSAQTSTACELVVPTHCIARRRAPLNFFVLAVSQETAKKALPQWDWRTHYGTERKGTAFHKDARTRANLRTLAKLPFAQRYADATGFSGLIYETSGKMRYSRSKSVC